VAWEVILGQGGTGDEPALVEDHDVVDRLGDLGQQVARQHHRAAGVGLAAEEVPQPVDALGVEAVGGFVEDEHGRLPEEGGGQAQALAHAEGEATDPAVGVLGHADPLQRLDRPPSREPRRRGEYA
jgi:hypothetical protein